MAELAEQLDLTEGEAHDAGTADQSSGTPDAGSVTESGAESADTGDAGKQAVSGGGGSESEAGGAAKAGAKADAGTGEQRQGTVPYAALAEAREQVRSLKAQIQELNAQPKLTKEDAELLADLRAQKAAADEQAKVPDYLDDPKGYVDAKVEAALKELQKTAETATNTAKETRDQVEQREQLSNLISTVQVHEGEFSKATPDYQKALAHMRQARFEQIQMLVPDATEPQIIQQIRLEELRAAAIAVQAGKNPAESAYKLAGTFGYRKAAAPAKEAEKSAEADRDAARTLAAVTAADSVAGEAREGVTTPEFADALAERFGRRR